MSSQVYSGAICDNSHTASPCFSSPAAPHYVLNSVGSICFQSVRLFKEVSHTLLNSQGHCTLKLLQRSFSMALNCSLRTTVQLLCGFVWCVLYIYLWQHIDMTKKPQPVFSIGCSMFGHFTLLNVRKLSFINRVRSRDHGQNNWCQSKKSKENGLTTTKHFQMGFVSF